MIITTLLLIVVFMLLKRIKREKFEDELKKTPESLKILLIIIASGIVISIGVIVYNYLKDRHLDRAASYVV